MTTTNNPGIRTIIPFNGSDAIGNNDRLFVSTAWGIYNCTTRGYSPVSYLFDPSGFPTFPAKAGNCISTSFTNTNGDHYLALCDGYWGYMVYSEKTQEWTRIREGNNAGEISGANPATFRHVMSWKNRLWFVPENGNRAYYLPPGQITGQLNWINFGARFRYGGNLVGLWNWTVDGGAGIDDMLVGISSAGDVVIYQGTDPSTPGAFGLKGVWWIGPVPPGRTIASAFGGDLFILSTAGCLPLSKLVAGYMVRDPNIYATAKVANIFNKLMSDRGCCAGWDIKIHPTDNLMMISVPPVPGQDRLQMVMSMASKGWATQDLPMSCMDTWHGKLYFGTDDLRVMVNDGYRDNVRLQDHETTGVEIPWTVQTSYQNLGSSTNKRVHMVRPYFISDGTIPGYQSEARYDFDTAGITITDTDPDNVGWDVALWNGATTPNFWDGNQELKPHQVKGTAGMGKYVSAIVKGVSDTNVTLAGLDVILDSGGIL